MSFFDTVQAFFMELTGRGIVLSSRDAELLFRWRSRGATAAVICKGIERAVAARGELPRDIWGCRTYVEPLVDEIRGRRAGAHPGEGEATTSEVSVAGAAEPNDTAADESFVEGDLGWEALRTIEEAGKGCERDEVRRVYRAAYLRVRNALEHHRDRLFTELVAADEALLEGFFAALSRDEQAAIEARLDEQLLDSGSREMLRKMSPSARTQHLRAQRRRLLAEAHGLISLLD